MKFAKNYPIGGDSLISWTVFPSAAGLVCVCATVDAVCDVALGDDETLLGQAVEQRFPAARRSDGTDFVVAWAQAIADQIVDVRRGVEPHILLHGTEFQQKVWNALREIERGTVVTYSRLAEMVGIPRGARAVAAACASNRLAILVPCHRVVGKDGGLAGFRWGVERKRKLLVLEGAITL